MKHLKYELSLRKVFIIFVISFLLFLWVLLFKINNYTIDFEMPSSVPFQITVTMPKDTMHERNFLWHTTKSSTRSDLELIEAVKLPSKNTKFSSLDNIIRISGKKSSKSYFGYIHRVKATGLKPGTKYYYRVGDSSKNIWSKIGEFKTDDGDSNFKFIFVSDSQSYVNEAKKFTFTIKTAKQTVKDAEFIVNVGDLVNDSCELNQWKSNLNFSVYGDITTVTAVGNHDYNYGCSSDYSFINNFYYDYLDQDTKSGVYYSFNYGNVHFTVLNTNDEYYSKLSEKQLEWFKKDLSSIESVNAKYRVVLMHRGVYSAGPHYYHHQDIISLTEQLTSVMADYNIDLVLQGHDHLYSLTYPIDKDGNIQDITYRDIYSSTINSNVKAMYHNTSPVYFTTDAAGVKHEAQLIKEKGNYAVDPKMNKNYNNVFETSILDKYFSKFQYVKSPYTKNGDRYGMFSSIEVNANDLIVNTYIVDNIHYGKVKLYNSFALTKD